MNKIVRIFVSMHVCAHKLCCKYVAVVCSERSCVCVVGCVCLGLCDVMITADEDVLYVHFTVFDDNLCSTSC